MKSRILLCVLLALATMAGAGVGVHWAMRIYEERLVPQRKIAWVPYAPGVVERARRSGLIVLLHSYAEWSATSFFTDERVFETPEVRKAIYRHGVLPVRADLTQPFPHMDDLRMHGIVTSDTIIVYANEPNTKGTSCNVLKQATIISAIEAAAAMRIKSSAAASVASGP